MVAFKNLGEAELTLFEAEELVEPCIGQPRDESDAIADLLNAANLFGARAKRGANKLFASMLEPGIRPGVRPGIRVGCHA